MKVMFKTTSQLGIPNYCWKNYVYYCVSYQIGEQIKHLDSQNRNKKAQRCYSTIIFVLSRHVFEKVFIEYEDMIIPGTKTCIFTEMICRCLTIYKDPCLGQFSHHAGVNLCRLRGHRVLEE